MAQGSSNPTQDIKKINSAPVDVGNGTSGLGTQRVVIASDQSVIPISDNGQSLTVDGVVELGATSLAALENINVNINAGDLSIGNVDVTSLPSLPAGSNTIGSVSQAGTWNINSVTTLPSISGTVVANIGTSGGLALDTTLTNGDQKSVIRSGSKGTTAAADVTSTVVDTNTQALDVSIKNSAIPVTGTFWQSTQPVSIAASVAVNDNSGSITVDAPVTTPVFTRLSDGTNPITTLPVSLSSLPPLATGSNAIGSITNTSFASTQSGTWNITNISGTVSLPTGASTEATLSGMSGKLPTTLGQKTASNSMAVVLASDQSVVPVSGSGSFTVAQATATNLNATVVGTGTFAVQAAQTGTWNVNNITGTVSLPTGASTETTLSAISGKLPATLGQKASAASMSVVVASDQSTIPVSLASVPSHPVTNTGTFAVQAAQSGTWNITNISGTVSLPTGAATDSTVSTMSGKLPATIGQKTAANSMAVVVASDQSNVPVISNNSEVRISANFTRPADTAAYTTGDLVANSTTAGSVAPLTFTNAVRTAGDCVRIERIRVEKSSTSLSNASFRLHLFEASPTPTVGDNGVFNSSSVLASNNVLNHVGTFPVTMQWSGSDGAIGIGVPTTGAGVTASPTSGTSLFGLLEVTAAYTPVSSEVFYVVLEGYRT